MIDLNSVQVGTDGRLTVSIPNGANPTEIEHLLTRRAFLDFREQGPGGQWKTATAERTRRP
jgi:hypothetical protein